MLRRFTIGEVNGVKNNIRKIFIHLKLHTDILHTLEYIMKAKKKFSTWYDYYDIGIFRVIFSIKF